MKSEGMLVVKIIEIDRQQGLELESSLCVFVFLIGLCFVIFSELIYVLVDHGGFVLLLSGTLSLDLLVCPNGLAGVCSGETTV